jgi:hypothetical protein
LVGKLLDGLLFGGTPPNPLGPLRGGWGRVTALFCEAEQRSLLLFWKRRIPLDLLGGKLLDGLCLGARPQDWNKVIGLGEPSFGVLVPLFNHYPELKPRRANVFGSFFKKRTILLDCLIQFSDVTRASAKQNKVFSLLLFLEKRRNV